MSTQDQNLVFLKDKWTVAELGLIYKSVAKTDVKITQSRDAFKVCMTMWNKELIEIQEQFAVIFLNRRNEVIAFRHISTGSMVGTVVDIKLIASLSLQTLACGIILAHNHPSKNLKPSQADISITNKLNSALSLFEINVLDHLILTQDSFFSFRDEGIL